MPSCGPGRSRPRGLLGVDLGLLRRRHGSVRPRARRRARCPAPTGFLAPRLSYAEHVFRGKADDEVAIRHASELRPLAEWTWGELQSARGSGGRRAARERRRARRPRRRLPARTSPRRSPPSSAARRSAPSGRAARRTSALSSVVDRLAQIEPKVLLAVDGYRYGGQGLRPERRDRRVAARAADAPCGRCSTLPYLEGGDWEPPPRPTSSSRSCRSTTRSGCSTRPGRPACRRRSSTARAGSCSST